MGISKSTKVISVFGSHAPRPGSRDYEIARELGRLLAEAEFAVSTGGYDGTMAAVSQGAAEAGGHVIGITSNQVERSRSIRRNQWVQEEIRYDTLAERLTHLVTNNQGMIVLPGGIGTLLELSLAWGLMQVQEMERRPLILIGRLWSDTIDTFTNPEYIAKNHLDLIKCAMTPAGAITLLL